MGRSNNTLPKGHRKQTQLSHCSGKCSNSRLMKQSPNNNENKTALMIYRYCLVRKCVRYVIGLPWINAGNFQMHIIHVHNIAYCLCTYQSYKVEVRPLWNITLDLTFPMNIDPRVSLSQKNSVSWKTSYRWQYSTFKQWQKNRTHYIELTGYNLQTQIRILKDARLPLLRIDYVWEKNELDMDYRIINVRTSSFLCGGLHGHTDSESSQHFWLGKAHNFILCSWRESNLSPMDLESYALPIEPPPSTFFSFGA